MVLFKSFAGQQLAVMSAFLGPDQTATEAMLTTDKDVSPWVQKYQRSRETVSQTDYEVRFSIHIPFSRGNSGPLRRPTSCLFNFI